MEEVTGLIAVGTGICIWYAWIGCFCSFRKTNKDLKRTRDS